MCDNADALLLCVRNGQRGRSWQCVRAGAGGARACIDYADPMQSHARCDARCHTHVLCACDARTMQDSMGVCGAVLTYTGMRVCLRMCVPHTCILAFKRDAEPYTVVLTYTRGRCGEVDTIRGGGGCIQSDLLSAGVGGPPRIHTCTMFALAGEGSFSRSVPPTAMSCR